MNTGLILLACATLGQLGAPPSFNPSSPPPVRLDDQPAEFNAPQGGFAPAAQPLAPQPNFDSQPTFQPQPAFQQQPQSGGFAPQPTYQSEPTLAPAPEGNYASPAGGAASLQLAPNHGGVQPVASTAPVAPSGQLNQGFAASSTAATLLDGSLAPPQRNALAGNPLTLHDAIARVSDPSRRLATVKHYWFVTYLVGEYHGALDEFERLQQLGRPQRQTDAAALETARHAASARLREAELNAVVAQYELAELAGAPVVDALPLPSDRPLVTAYATKIETVFAGRSPPLNLRRIDRTLPLRQGVLQARANSLAAALEAVHVESEAFRNGQSDAAGVIAAMAAVRENRTAFLMAVRQYNFDIAEYAVGVAPAGMNPTTLVSMLIGGGSKSPMRSVLVPTPSGAGPIAPVAHLEPIDANAVNAANSDASK